MRNFLSLLLVIISISIGYSQFAQKDGNRIGVSFGVSQATLTTNNFNTKPDIGYSGGLSVRGNYYNNWSMIYGMQFFIHNVIIETTSPTFKQTDSQYSLYGAQLRLLMSYNIIKNHISLDFGPVVQFNDKLSVKDAEANYTINGTALKANQIEDVSKFSGLAYIGCSAGTKVVRLNVFYTYGFTNILDNLNTKDGLKALNGNNSFKGNYGVINGQIVFNL
jgi:hypothetical protein